MFKYITHSWIIIHDKCLMLTTFVFSVRKTTFTTLSLKTGKKNNFDLFISTINLITPTGRHNDIDSRTRVFQSCHPVFSYLQCNSTFIRFDIFHCFFFFLLLLLHVGVSWTEYLCANPAIDFCHWKCIGSGVGTIQIVLRTGYSNVFEFYKFRSI